MMELGVESVIFWTLVVLKQLATVVTNFVPEIKADRSTVNVNFTVIPTSVTHTIPSNIPKMTNELLTFNPAISNVTHLQENDPVIPSLTLARAVRQSLLPWPESWRYEIKEYLNVSNIADPDRRVIIENQMYYCPKVQLCNITFKTPDLPPNVFQLCCDSCSCNVDCIDKGTCCPDFSPELAADDLIQETCVLPQYRKFMQNAKNYERSYYMRFTCLKNFKNQTTINLCKTIEEFPRTLEKFLGHNPVTSNATKIIYRNIYCAMCNNEEEKHLYVWKTGVSCNKKLYIFPNSFISLLKFIQNEKQCNIFYYSPSDLVYPKECFWGQITHYNHTGEMPSYDPVLEIGCNSYTSLYDGIYRNVHCFMCNHMRTPQINGCGKDGSTSPMDMAAFGALLDFNVFEDEEQTNNHLTFQDRLKKCQSDEIYDGYRNVCRIIECSDGFVYFNKTCKRIYTEEYLKSYEVYFRSTIDNAVYLNISCLFSNISNFITRKLPNTLERELCALNVILDREYLHCTNCSSNESAIVIVHVEVTSNSLHTVEQFITDILSLQDEPIIVTNTKCGKINNQELYLSIDSYNYVESTTFGQYNRKYVKPGTSKSLPFRSALIPMGIFCNSPLRLVRVMNNIACPRISLQKTEYNFTFLNGDICIKEIDECFESGYYTNMTDKIIVCKDDYLSRIANLLNSATKEKITKCQITVDDVFNMVTYICLILSVVSLLITLVIYFCFRELRTIPGKNNMLLSGNLLIAQLLFLFGSGKNELEIGCKVIGLFLHLFWLSSIFMMSSSTIHMARVFAVFEKPNNLQNQSDSALAIYTTYSFTMSGVFVLINVVSNLVKTDGKEIGYGGCICYISTKVMVGITFALPVGIVILSNNILFIIVIVSIKKLSKLKNSSGNHRNLLVIYAKLSCLTGLTWVFGFVNEIIQSKILSYLFVIFNAGQGVYIMLAFICNKRVLRMFCRSKRRNAKKKRRYVTGSRDSSTTSKQTFTSYSSVSTVTESIKNKKDVDTTFDSHQSKMTRL